MLAKALERCDWSVWWDRIIPPGRAFDEVIEAELGASRCVITLWSKAGITSRWVREEAQEALNSAKLVPAMLDPVDPPLGFRRVHAADLAGWRGDDGHPGWQDLKAAVSDLLGEPPLKKGVKTAPNEGVKRARMLAEQKMQNKNSGLMSFTWRDLAALLLSYVIVAAYGVTVVFVYLASNLDKNICDYTSPCDIWVGIIL